MWKVKTKWKVIQSGTKVFSILKDITVVEFNRCIDPQQMPDSTTPPPMVSLYSLKGSGLCLNSLGARRTWKWEREIGFLFFFFHVSSRPTESFEVDDMTLERSIRSQIPLTNSHSRTHIFLRFFTNRCQIPFEEESRIKDAPVVKTSDGLYS